MASSVTTLLHYRVLEKIGEGGMGVVYRAIDTRLDREVALKLMPPDSAADPDRKRRFMIEARAASALNHPNIVTIHDVASADGTDFLVMEYVRGDTISARIKQAAMPVADVVQWGIQIADALAKAHLAGIVHRDLKPSNIMITPDGLAKVMDFGLAKLDETKLTAASGDNTLTLQTQAGVLIGTMAYMSPEQAEGKPVDGRSDVFSFGAVLHEMITGRRAFQRESSISTLVAVLREDAPSVASLRGGVSTALDHVIGRCLRKDPARRFQSMTEVKSALEDVRAELSTASVAAAVVPEVPSIAVLPFSNLSADKENEYFGDGLTEEIINALTRVEGLRVIARTSSFRFRGDLDLKDVGEKLSVRHVLEGSVRKAGTRIRITAQLISIADESHLWSQRYDREFQDIFEIQDEIARAIVEELKLKLAPSEPVSQAACVRLAGNLEAYGLALQGRYHLQKLTPDGLARAKACFEQAISLDPNCAMAHTSLSAYWFSLGAIGLMPPRQAFVTARAAADKALELDPTLPESHAISGALMMNHEYDWEGARREFEIALAYNPSSVIPRAHLAHMLVNGYGRYQEAAANMQRVLELDPVSPAYRAVTGCYFLFAGNTQRAIEESKLTLQTDPGYHWAHWTLGMAFSELGQHDEAIASMERAFEFSGHNPIGFGALAFLHARAGHVDEPRQLLEKLEAVVPTRYVSTTAHCMAYLGLGQLDDALKAFETSIENRDFTAQWFRHTPFRAHFKEDPRYLALLGKMNME